eukprot:245106_1
MYEITGFPMGSTNKIDVNGIYVYTKEDEVDESVRFCGITNDICLVEPNTQGYVKMILMTTSEEIAQCQRPMISQCSGKRWNVDTAGMYIQTRRKSKRTVL